jgi:DNA-directed RNA polymerase specialized sigma24 family protein
MKRHDFAGGRKVPHLKFDNKYDTEEAIREYLNKLPPEERAAVINAMLKAMGVKNPRSEKEIVDSIVDEEMKRANEIAKRFLEKERLSAVWPKAFDDQETEGD